MRAPKRIRAASAQGMRKTLVAIPNPLRRRLEAIRRREGLVLGECVRQALETWLKLRSRKERGK